MRMFKIAGLFLAMFFAAGAVFANERSGTVVAKTLDVDKKGRTSVKVYIDTTGSGAIDTMLSFQIAPKKDNTAALQNLESMLASGTRVVFDDANMQSPAGFYKTITWHDLIAVNDNSLAALYPNPAWFPYAFSRL